MKHTYNILIIILLLVIAFLLYKKAEAPETINQPDPVATTTAQNPELKQVLPANCVDGQPSEAAPVITSLSTYTVSIGNPFIVYGCNFSGFEGDKTLFVEDIQTGTRGLMYAEPGSTEKVMTYKLKTPLCQTDTSYSGKDCEAFLNITPGLYRVYTYPWGKESNKVMIRVI